MTNHEPAILSHLQGVTKTTTGWMAKCPYHEDRTASLSVTQSDSKTLLCCHAGCSTENVLEAVGLKMADLFINPQRDRTIVKAYPYVDEQGQLLFETVRFQPKDFAQRRPNGNSGWIWNLKGVKRVLYRLPEVLSADAVLICEGEKDCDTASSLGFIATTNPNGSAGKWRDEYSEALRGKHVTIIPDADAPGAAHGQDVARSLSGVAASIKVLALPQAKDLTEWVESGGSSEELSKLIHAAPDPPPTQDVADHTPPEIVSAQGQTPRVRVWAEKKLRFRTGCELGEESNGAADYLFGRLAVCGAITELHAKIKRGKTSLFLQGAKAMLDGTDFLGLSKPPIPAVVYLSEQPLASFREQVMKAGLGFCPNIHTLGWAETFGTPWPLVVHTALAKCKEVGSPILFIDTTHPFFQRSGVSENDAEVAIENMRPLQEIAAENIAVICGRHERKSSGELADSGRGSSAYGGAVDILISMGRPAGNHPETFRELNCVSRFSETPTTMILDFDPETNLYTPIGTTESVEVQRARIELLRRLPHSEGDAVTLTDAAKELDLSRSTCQRAIESLLAEDSVSRLGEGKRSDPFKYWSPEKVSAQTPSLDGQKESRPGNDAPTDPYELELGKQVHAPQPSQNWLAWQNRQKPRSTPTVQQEKQ